MFKISQFLFLRTQAARKILHRAKISHYTVFEHPQEKSLIFVFQEVRTPDLVYYVNTSTASVHCTTHLLRKPHLSKQKNWLH